MLSRDLMIADKLTDRARSGTNRLRISWRRKKTKNILKKIHVIWRDLVIIVKLAQFLTDRAQSGTSRFRMLPEVS